jgi:hypothetical protein
VPATGEGREARRALLEARARGDREDMHQALAPYGLEIRPPRRRSGHLRLRWPFEPRVPSASEPFRSRPFIVGGTEEFRSQVAMLAGHKDLAVTFADAKLERNG